MVCTVRQNHLRFPLQRRCKHRLFVFPCRLCFCFLCFLYFLCFLGFPLLLRLRNLDCFALYRCHRLFLLQGLAAPCFFSVHGTICHPCSHRQQAKAAANRHNLQASCGSSFFLIHINTSDAIVAIGGFFYSRIEKEIPV